MGDVERRPTVRQVYALAAAMCERAGEAFPETREQASEVIERLRLESGHPAARLSQLPFRPARQRRGQRRVRRGREDERRASDVAAKLVSEMR